MKPYTDEWLVAAGYDPADVVEWEPGDWRYIGPGNPPGDLKPVKASLWERKSAARRAQAAAEASQGKPGTIGFWMNHGDQGREGGQNEGGEGGKGSTSEGATSEGGQKLVNIQTGTSPVRSTARSMGRMAILPPQFGANFDAAVAEYLDDPDDAKQGAELIVRLKRLSPDVEDLLDLDLRVDTLRRLGDLIAYLRETMHDGTRQVYGWEVLADVTGIAAGQIRLGPDPVRRRVYLSRQRDELALHPDPTPPAAAPASAPAAAPARPVQGLDPLTRLLLEPVLERLKKEPAPNELTPEALATALAGALRPVLGALPAPPASPTASPPAAAPAPAQASPAPASSAPAAAQPEPATLAAKVGQLADEVAAGAQAIADTKDTLTGALAKITGTELATKPPETPPTPPAQDEPMTKLGDMTVPAAFVKEHPYLSMIVANSGGLVNFAQGAWKEAISEVKKVEEDALERKEREIALKERENKIARERIELNEKTRRQREERKAAESVARNRRQHPAASSQPHHVDTEAQEEPPSTPANGHAAYNQPAAPSDGPDPFFSS